MDEQQLVQTIETQNPVSPVVPEEPKKNNNPIIIVLGLVILLVAFAGAVILLNNSSQTKEATTPAATVTADQNVVKNTADLDKVSSQLDTTDLTTFETDLQQNDIDSSAF